jgi:hypothetical protein
MNREAAARYLREGANLAAFDKLFHDRGRTSLTELAGPGYVVLDGSAFFRDAHWLYEDHHEFEEPFGEEESATLIVPTEIVRRWRRGLQNLPANGEVARTAGNIRDSLVDLMDTVLNDDALALTVASLL